MNLFEVLTGTSALVVAMLVAHNESTPIRGTDSQRVSGHLVSGQSSAAQPSAAQPSAARPAASKIARAHTITWDGEVAAPAQPVMPPPLKYGRARMIHAPTPCDVPAFSEGGPGAPYFVADGWPRAGQPFRVDWSTKPTGPGDSPAWPAMLLVSYDLSAPMPLAALGAPGCHLLVQPDFIMTPKPGSILTQFGGCISLDWTPRGGLVGFTLYAQLLVSAPSVNTGGFLVSPALHIQVGS